MPKVTKTTKETKKVVAPKKATLKPHSAKAALGKKAVAKKITVPEKETPAEAVKKPSKDMKVQTELVKKYRSGAKDTGSVSVQIALLTERINQLAKHLTKHIHDFDSKRGLLILVGKRRRLLNYLRTSNEKIYDKLVKDLKLKK